MLAEVTASFTFDSMELELIIAKEKTYDEMDGFWSCQGVNTLRYRVSLY
jgi:hypothetical protein